MTNSPNAKKSPDHPVTCLCGSCVARRLDVGSWSRRSKVARNIAAELPVEVLGRLPAESRGCLRDSLSFGYEPGLEKQALDKILAAELLDKIPAAKLVEVEYQPGINIKGTQDFIDEVGAHLDYIARVPTGGRLLRSLARSGATVTIVPTSRANQARPDNYRAATARGKALRWRDESGKKRAINGTGMGASTTIKYNPDLMNIGSVEAWQKQPPGIWLAHELIHADDAAYGRMDPEEKDGVRNYERQAIGLLPYEQKEFTENKLRAEWDEPQPVRPRY